MIITTSWDDGSPLDVRLCSILKQNRIEGTIYAPVMNAEIEVMNAGSLKELSRDFEIGGHTYNHTVLTLANKEKIDEELCKSKEQIERITGREVISFCYPKGKYNKDVIERVKKAGYKGARTIKVFRTTPSHPYEHDTTVHAADKLLCPKMAYLFTTDCRGLAFRLLLKRDIFRRWDVIAKRTLDYVLENGGIWHMWGHSWEIDQNNDWPLLKDVLEYTRLHGGEYGAEFVTNGEIFTNA